MQEVDTQSKNTGKEDDAEVGLYPETYTRTLL